MRPWTLVLVAVVGSACGPRLGIRRELPARIDLGPDIRALAVFNAQQENALTVVLDPIGALARTTLTPHAVHELELQLSRSSRYQVMTGCGPFCPAADGAVEVAVVNARVDPGDRKRSEAKTAWATVRVRIVKRSGLLAFSDDYTFSRTGAVPGPEVEQPADADMLVACVTDAVRSVAADLHPQWIDESFPLEKDGPLEPFVEAAAAGDLERAEAIARDVLAAQPGNAAAIYSLGVVFTARGRLEEALEAFRAAAAIDPKYRGYAAGAERRLMDRQILRSQSR